MLIVFPVSLREREQALRLFAWIEETGAGRNHDALLLLGKPAAAARFEMEIKPRMERCFKSVIAYEIPIEYGPQWNPKDSPDASGANNMFTWGSIYCDDVLHRRFFWNESDAIPTKASAYDEIEREDLQAGKPFMGARENVTPPRLSGIAVYPTEMPNHSVLIRNAGQQAWDIAAAGEIMPLAHVTANIQNVHWLGGECRAAERWDGRAAIFHQCKCGCLYDRLRGSAKADSFPADSMSGAERLEIAKNIMDGADKQLLLVRIAELEAQLLDQSRRFEDLKQVTPKYRIHSNPSRFDMIDGKLVRRVSDGNAKPANPNWKTPKSRRKKKPKADTRTPEQIQLAKERMARARAGKQLVK